MTIRPCPVCGSDDDSRVFAEEDFDTEQLDAFAFASRKLPEYMHYRLVECPVCDALYASPAPSAHALAEAYLEADFDSSEEAALAAHTYGRYLRKLAPGLGGAGGAMDIGAGDGVFLEVLIRAGFNPVVGVEPSSAPIQAAKPELRPMIRHGVFNAGDFEPGSFSLITCFQTMEHVHEPAEVCRGVYSLLRNGGAALFVCHNRRALSARILGMKSPIFDIEHLQLYSPTSLRELMQRSGFDRVRTVPIINRYPLRYWSKLFPLPSGVKNRVLKALETGSIGSVKIPLPAGNLAVIGYRREAASYPPEPPEGPR